METTIGHLGSHDLGGCVDSSIIEVDVGDRKLMHWELATHALLVILSSYKPYALVTTHELRRAVESMDKNVYIQWGYYEKWSAAMCTILLEKNVIVQQEIDSEFSHLYSNSFNGDHLTVLKIGDIVKVRDESLRISSRKPHLRCPGYIFGMVGTVTKVIGQMEDPFIAAYHGLPISADSIAYPIPLKVLYSVEFNLKDCWKNQLSAQETNVNIDPLMNQQVDISISSTDKIQLEIYEDWLIPLNDVKSHIDHDHRLNDDPECLINHDHNCDFSHRDMKHNHKHDDNHSQSIYHNHDHSEFKSVHNTATKQSRSDDVDNNHRQIKISKTSHNNHNADNISISVHSHDNGHDHAHHHGHENHIHSSRYDTELNSIQNENEINDNNNSNNNNGEKIHHVLISILKKKGIITNEKIQETIEKLENAGKEMKGAQLVARAWIDPEFKKRLLVN
eukprot:gene5954-8207_t